MIFHAVGLSCCYWQRKSSRVVHALHEGIWQAGSPVAGIS